MLLSDFICVPGTSFYVIMKHLFSFYSRSKLLLPPHGVEVELRSSRGGSTSSAGTNPLLKATALF